MKGIGMDLINKNFNQMIEATNSGDVSKMLDFSYPKLFDIQPREMIEQQFNQMQMMGIKNLVQGAKISDLSDFVSSDGMQFAKAKLSATNVMELSDASLVDMMFGQLKTMYSEDQMRKTDNGVEIDVVEDLYIIQDDATKKMYFLQAGAQVQPMLGQLLPADVIEKLK